MKRAKWAGFGAVTEDALGWTERYGCHGLALAGGAVTISVSWGVMPEDKGYVVSALGRTLKKRYSGLDEAKLAGVTLLRRILREATEELDAKYPREAA